jgi:hypothetical protein
MSAKKIRKNARTTKHAATRQTQEAADLHVARIRFLEATDAYRRHLAINSCAARMATCVRLAVARLLTLVVNCMGKKSHVRVKVVASKYQTAAVKATISGVTKVSGHTGTHLASNAAPFLANAALLREHAVRLTKCAHELGSA